MIKKKIIDFLKPFYDKEKNLFVVKFVYDITPQYGVKPSVKNATKEIFAYVEHGATEADCVSIFADHSLTQNFTYKINGVTMYPVKTVRCKK